METAVVTLTEFLLDQIAEDALAARYWHHGQCALANSDYTRPCDCGVPARVLAECEAKRRIVEVAMPGETDGPRTERGRTLRLLAAVYADHPDYRDEWRV